MANPTSRSRLLNLACAMCASLALLLTVAVAPARAQDSGAGGTPPPGAYYLSLGDSMAFGLQFDRLFEMLDTGTYAPEAFDTGYTDVVAERMRSLRPAQQTVNLSCPGETAATMIGGGCSFTIPEPDGLGLELHTSYDGAQLEAAVAFLEAHPEQVNPITLAIGGGDVVELVAETCGFDAGCIKRSGIREELGRRLNHIVHALQTAAPSAEIILVAFYNPFAVDVPGSGGLWRSYYTNVQRAAAARNGVLLADVSGLLDDHGPCRVTFMCSSGDFHPTDLGYALIARRIVQVAGYGA